MEKKIYLLAMTVGSYLGSYVPMLWGDADMLSLSGVIFSALCGLAGIYLAYRVIQP